MLFNSVEYILFFPIVACLYFAMPYNLRWGVLLAASYVFYMAWNPLYLLLIVASTLIDYGVALAMSRNENKSDRKRWLYLSLTANLGLLGSFKYLDFLGDALKEMLGLINVGIDIPHADLLLPVGISFYTFQTLSYTIEVYRGNQNAIRHLGQFALYVSFFPQLVAGPIERPQRLLPQLMQRYDFDYGRVVSGLRMVLWGLFKKVVIADRLAVVVDAVYMEPERYPGSILILATVFFALQIYCDFSGYTDIAIGCACVFGIDLMKNFDRPYLATSIPDFWRRWHISLSTWFRDYVFVPLGGSRGTTQQWLVALAATFGLSGLWHGANWTFLVWGLLHLAYYLIGHVTRPTRARITAWTGAASFPRLLLGGQMIFTFGLVCIAWVFFRADSVETAWYILSHSGDRFFDFSANGGFTEIVASWDISLRAFELNIMLIVFLILSEVLFGRTSVGEAMGTWKPYLRWPVYIALSMAIMNFGITREIPFVYFQF